jgi:hypothetical protein
MTRLARTSVYWIKATTEGARRAHNGRRRIRFETDGRGPRARESAHTLCVCLLFGLDQLLNLIYKHAARPTKYKGVIRKHAKSALASRRSARALVGWLGEYAGARRAKTQKRRTLHQQRRRSAPHIYSLASR